MALTIVLLTGTALIATLRFLPDRPGQSPAATSTPAENPTAATSDQGMPPVGLLPRSSDPDAFARSVAEALFIWDTTSTSLPDQTEQLLVTADPTGDETPGLLVDLRTYLPSDRAWAQLGQYETRQWIEVTDVLEPVAWDEALTRVPDGTIASGTTARTVTGIRHRAGTWDGTPVTTRSEVRFTMFLVCGPTYDTCHLLRLSTPGLALH